MKELNGQEKKQVTGGALQFILLADFAAAAGVGSLAKKLWNKYFS